MTILIVYKRENVYKRKPKGKPRMENSEKLAILGTQDKRQRQTKQNT